MKKYNFQLGIIIMILAMMSLLWLGTELIILTLKFIFTL